MTQILRVDAAKYAAVMAHLRRTQPDAADMLQSAIAEGPQPGDRFEGLADEPNGVSRVLDREGDAWIRKGGVWICEVDDYTQTPWRGLLSYWGPVTVIA